MHSPIILIGTGEMGGVFARGFLKLGHPVVPVVRAMNPNEMARQIPNPQAVVLAVGEKDLTATLDALPDAWKSALVLLQNELLPHDWLSKGLNQATVISVWFEKKPGQDAKVILPSPVFGPRSELIKAALGALNIPVRVCATDDELLFELVLKNVYILTTNICGLKVGGTVGELWSAHQEFCRQVAGEVMDVQFKLVGRSLDRGRLLAGMVAAFEKDPSHKCMGRTASARLERVLFLGRQFQLNLPTIAGINPS